MTKSISPKRLVTSALAALAIVSLSYRAPPAGAVNAARFGYYWKNNSLP